MILKAIAISLSVFMEENRCNIEFIKRIIAYIESNLCGYKKKFIYSMTTNAILLSKYIDYLVEKGFKLLISLDGDDKVLLYAYFTMERLLLIR